MKLQQIYEKLDELSPFALAASWDNSGLQIGDKNQEITKIYLALECTGNIVQNAKENSLIIVHHPLIFKPLKNLDFSFYQSEIIRKIITKNISLIAMHTNFDISHLNTAFAKNLGFETAQDGFMCVAQTNGSFRELTQKIKNILNLQNISTVEPIKDSFSKIAFVCGSGGDLIDKIDADVFITGDVKYHQAISAKERGLGVIDATHYSSEAHFAQTLYPLITNLGIDIEIFTQQSPFKEA